MPADEFAERAAVYLGADASALAAARWTSDLDFFGCGAPVWITETLLPHLEAR